MNTQTKLRVFSGNEHSGRLASVAARGARFAATAITALAASIATATTGAPCAQWNQTWDPGGGEYATGGITAVADDGSIYVAGRIGVSDNDMVLVKYDSAGNLLWQTTYDGTAGGDESPTDIEVTAEGVSIVGASLGLAPTRGITQPETVLLDYSSDGTLIRERRTLGPEIPGFLQPQLAIGVDGRRVIGTDDGAGNCVVEAYTSTGSPIFQTPFALSGFAGVSALAVNENLDAFVVFVEDFNRYIVVKLDANGNQQWSHTEAFTGLVLGEAFITTIGTDLVVVGSGEPPCISPVARVWRHSADGTVQWTTELPDDCTFAIAVGLSAAPDGGVYLAARATIPASFLAHLDADGNVSWVTHAGGDGDVVGFSGLATGLDGNALVGGTISPQSDITAYDVLVQSYDSAGTLDWSTSYAGAAGDADFFNAISVGAVGTAAVVATVDPGIPVQNIATLGFPFAACPGDIDGDGDVDLADLATLLATYPSCIGDASYNPAADLNGNGCVDLSDLATLLANYAP